MIVKCFWLFIYLQTFSERIQRVSGTTPLKDFGILKCDPLNVYQSTWNLIAIQDQKI